MPPADAVRRSIVLPLAAEAAWEALADPDRLASWLADAVQGERLEPGAALTFFWRDGRVRHAVVEEVDRPVRLTFRWRAEGTDEPTRVELSLEELFPDAARTRLTVEESGLAALSVRGRELHVAPTTPRGPAMAAGPALAAGPVLVAA